MSSLTGPAIDALKTGWKSVLVRAGKVGAPTTGVLGLFADLGSPVANFTLILTCVFGAIMLLAGFMWFGHHRRKMARALADGKITPDEAQGLAARSGWSVTFAFSLVATIVMGGVLLTQRLANAEKDGFMAKLVPALGQLQEKLGLVHRDVQDVKESTARIEQDTTALKEDTREIKKSLQEITTAFAALCEQKSTTEDPKSPEEWYHNARIYEERGDRRAARKAYAEFFHCDLDVFDPWQNFVAILKAEEGLAGARESLATLAAGSATRSSQLGQMLALDPAPRAEAVTKFAAEHPDYGPALYMASREYSQERLGKQTLADEKTELGWLEKFAAANKAGQVYKYYLDKRQADAAVADVDRRLAYLKTRAAALANPVHVAHQLSNQGWTTTIQLTDADAEEIFVKFDDDADFYSTGHQSVVNPRTSKPLPIMSVTLPTPSSGKHTLQVKYTDGKGMPNGPYTMEFDTATAQLGSIKPIVKATATSWVQFSQGNIYFTSILSYRNALKAIRYSFDSDAMDKEWDFEPWDQASIPTVGSDYKKPTYMKAPAGAKTISLRVTFKDGETAEVKELPIP